MFDAPLHPKIVHIPMALATLMPLISIGLLVAWWKDWLPDKTWWIAVALQAVMFGSGWVAMQTGEQDEEKVEQVLASEEPIEVHEERAEVFFWASGGLLAVMVLPMVIPGASRKRWIAVAASAGTVAVFWLGYRVGQAGGDLVYKHGAADAHIDAAASPGGTTGGEHEEAEEEEEDDD